MQEQSYFNNKSVEKTDTRVESKCAVLNFLNFERRLDVLLCRQRFV